MLRKISIYMIGLVTLVWALSGCQKILEVEVTNSVPFEEYFSTPAHAQEQLNAAYEALGSGGFLGGNVQTISELMADNVAEKPATNNGDWAAFFTRTTDIFLGPTRSMSHDGGKAIARANFLIDTIKVVESLPLMNVTA
ncbi:MAG: hypothetical protein R3B47_12825 [Bacteroidia bacterium]